MPRERLGAGSPGTRGLFWHAPLNMGSLRILVHKRVTDMNNLCLGRTE